MEKFDIDWTPVLDFRRHIPCLAGVPIATGMNVAREFEEMYNNCTEIEQNAKELIKKLGLSFKFEPAFYNKEIVGYLNLYIRNVENVSDVARSLINYIILNVSPIHNEDFTFTYGLNDELKNIEVFFADRMYGYALNKIEGEDNSVELKIDANNNNDMYLYKTLNFFIENDDISRIEDERGYFERLVTEGVK